MKPYSFNFSCKIPWRSHHRRISLSFILCTLLLAPGWINNMQASPLIVHRKVADLTVVYKKTEPSKDAKTKKIKPGKQRKKGKLKAFLIGKWNGFKCFIQKGGKTLKGLLQLFGGMFATLLWLVGPIFQTSGALFFIAGIIGFIGGTILILRGVKILFPKKSPADRVILGILIALVPTAIIIAILLSNFNIDVSGLGG